MKVHIQQIKFNILMILFEVILGQKFRKKSEFGKSKWFSQGTLALKPKLNENFRIYFYRPKPAVTKRLKRWPTLRDHINCKGLKRPS